jgi:hypothetical protein
MIGMTPLEKINRECRQCREWTRMQMLEVRPRTIQGLWPVKWMVCGGDEIHSREFVSPKGLFAV